MVMRRSRDLVGIRGDERLAVDHQILGTVTLEPFAPSQEAAVVEHILAGWIQSPVVAFAGIPRLSRDLDEAVVQREVVTYRVLPGGEPLAIIGESVHDELADSG